MDRGQRRSIFPDVEKAAGSEPPHPSGGAKRKGMLPGQVDLDIKFMEHFRSLCSWFSQKPRGRNGQIQVGPQNKRLGYPGGCLFFPRLYGEPRCLQPAPMQPTLPVLGKPARVSYPSTSRNRGSVVGFTLPTPTPFSSWKWGTGLVYGSAWRGDKGLSRYVSVSSLSL